MKFLVYVLSALLLFSYVSAGEDHCEDVDPSRLDTDLLRKEALIQGIQWLFQQAADKYGISSDSNVEVTNVKSICGWQDGNDVYNIFEVDATNNDDATLDATLTVNCKDDDSAPPKVTKWNYHIEYKTDSDEEKQGDDSGDADDAEKVEVKVDLGDDTGNDEEEQGEGEAQPLPETEEECQGVDISQLVTFDKLKDAFDIGIMWLFRQAADKYRISRDLSIEVTKVTSICNWQDGNDIYNRFEVEATNNEDASLQTTFTVRCKDDDSLPPKVIKWKYHIEHETDDDGAVVEVDIPAQNDDNHDDDDNDETTDHEENTEDNNDTEDHDDNSDVQVEIDFGSDDEQEEGGESEDQQPLPETEEDCQDIDISQLKTFELLREAFDDGIEWLFQQAADTYGTSADSNIEVIKVRSICNWQDGNDIYNRFEVDATNNNDVTVQAKFTVNCKDDDSADPKVIKWKYHIEYKDGSENQNDDVSSD